MATPSAPVDYLWYMCCFYLKFNGEYYFLVYLIYSKESMNAYFISGLGADEQMFLKTKLPKGFVIHHLAWLRPSKGETFPAYAERLAEKIDQRQPFILVGLSLGGMMAIEMNKFLKPAYTILISSVTNRKGLPFWFKLASLTGIYKIVPDYFYHHRNFITAWLLGAVSKEDKDLLSHVMLKADPVFVKWAVPRILKWDNHFIPENMQHLHGTADVILPYRPNKRTLPVKNGTHFMVYNRYMEVNQLLAKVLDGAQIDA